jgi:hypothetical protein
VSKVLLPRSLTLLLAMLPCNTVLADVVDEEITCLIISVEKSACVFVRNRDEHAADNAADHLRLKYRRGMRYATSAENFIDRLASKSSWTDKPYFINCPDSVEHTSKDWLTQKLMSFCQAQGH